MTLCDEQLLPDTTTRSGVDADASLISELMALGSAERVAARHRRPVQRGWTRRRVAG